jgi:tetratricopeptide (TPR) repeat protein
LLQPDSAEVHSNLGNVLAHLGRYQDALKSYRIASELNPNSASAHCTLGALFDHLGRRAEAIESYNNALQSDPGCASAHRNLCRLQSTVGNAQLDRIHDLLAGKNCSDHDRCQLHFALGNAYDNKGLEGKAFEHFQLGNRLRKAELAYNIRRDETIFSAIKASFEKTFEPLRPSDANRQTPVFIVGMPRSGTSLTEQILASHSRVYGAGELSHLQKAIFSGGFLGLSDANNLRAIREAYLQSISLLDTDMPYIVDKMPLNFMYIGYILSALPEAKIIHIQRDPRATCFSIYKRYFSSSGNGYAYDLRDVARFYKLYEGIMDFWNTTFPGSVYELKYEVLTEKQETETRNLLDYVGLEWEARCLKFHETERVVFTASSNQVREAMYQGSSNEWKAYRVHLTPMLEVLES